MITNFDWTIVTRSVVGVPILLDPAVAVISGFDLAGAGISHPVLYYITHPQFKYICKLYSGSSTFPIIKLTRNRQAKLYKNENQLF
jgi:hypothetical protein